MRYFEVVLGCLGLRFCMIVGYGMVFFLLYEGCLGWCLFDTETKKIGCFL